MVEGRTFTKEGTACGKALKQGGLALPPGTGTKAIWRKNDIRAGKKVRRLRVDQSDVTERFKQGSDMARCEYPNRNAGLLGMSADFKQQAKDKA